VAKTKLIVNLTQGQCLCVSELADSPLPRMRGLMGRPGLPAGEGLLLTPAPAIHTAFMRFPIDALFLDSELRVLDIRESLAPWRLASKRTARSVLELAAGECARRRVEVGHRLELRDREPMVADSVGPEVIDGSASADSAAGVQPQSTEVARLRPLRVLVLSPDHEFRSVMSLLLARRNCSVTTTGNAGRVPEIVLRERPDVAVIDVSDPAVGAAFASVEALGPPLGVVLVEDSADSRRYLPKWGPFEDLIGAVEAAGERHGPRDGRRG
jgi:uncharacterized membrane protein (UPF0127 family)